MNRSLVARFLVSAANELAPGGEVHVTHKVGLQQWCIAQQGHGTGEGEGRSRGFVAEGEGEDVAKDGGAATGLRYAGAVVFDRSAYPPYKPRKALTAKGFPIGDAQTFVFVRDGGSGGAMTPQRAQPPLDADARRALVGLETVRRSFS